MLYFLPIFRKKVIKKLLTFCYWENLLLSVERSADVSRFIFCVKTQKLETRTPWNSRRWFLAMETA